MPTIEQSQIYKLTAEHQVLWACRSAIFERILNICASLIIFSFVNQPLKEIYISNAIQEEAGLWGYMNPISKNIPGNQGPPEKEIWVTKVNLLRKRYKPLTESK